MLQDFWGRVKESLIVHKNHDGGGSAGGNNSEPSRLRALSFVLIGASI
jgi:hypothetical protein